MIWNVVKWDVLGGFFTLWPVWCSALLLLLPIRLFASMELTIKNCCQPQVPQCHMQMQQATTQATKNPIGSHTKSPPSPFLIVSYWVCMETDPSQTIHRVTWTTFSVKIVKIQNIFIWFFFLGEKNKGKIGRRKKKRENRKE